MNDRVCQATSSSSHRRGRLSDHNSAPPRKTEEKPRAEQENGEDTFESDVLEGLLSSPKTLPCKYFYDAKGSHLFEQICATEEYYVTRTELSLLRQVCTEIAPLIGPGADVLEPGSGAGEKIRTLLDALQTPRSFIPIDISPTAVAQSAQELERDYPELHVVPVVADFTQPFSLPRSFQESRAPAKVVFFPGSTISNFAPADAREFLSGLRALLSAGDFLFIGVDRIKDPSILERAYDDSQGVTAAFNLNLLHRIARDLPTDLDPRRFSHRATYNSNEERIEMHLVSEVDHTVTLCGERLDFRQGETIHTENSYKYSIEGFCQLAGEAGFRVLRTDSDRDNLFSLYLCQVPAP